MKNILIILFTLSIGFSVNAQIIKGKVTDNKNEPLESASIYWLNNSNGTTTNEKEEFEIKRNSDTSNKLIASFSGYHNDTVEINTLGIINFKLTEGKSLSAVTVIGQKPGQYISNLNPYKTEVITSLELKKGACCDLAGCFNTNASIQPATTNIVTDSQELRVLGLSGVYNQVLLDGFLLIRD